MYSRKFFIFAIVVACSGLRGGAEEPRGGYSLNISDASAYSNPQYWVKADALFLERSQNYSANLVLDEDNGLNPVLTGNDLEFGVAAGPRVTAGRSIGTSWSFEGTYFGLHDWTTTGTSIGNNNRSIPGDLALATFDFFGADAVQAVYGSKIQNVEANFRRKFDNLELLAGFRFFSLEEDFQLATFDANTFQSNYLIDTGNQLYGGQVGARLNLERGYFAFRPEVKFGVFGNNADQHSLVRDLNNSLTLRDVSDSSDATSLLTDLTLAGDCQLTSCLSVSFGYNMFWATNLAQAPYQLDFTDSLNSSQFIDSDHSLFMHGASVGFVIQQ